MAARLVIAQPEIPSVSLVGTAVVAITQAIPELEARLGRKTTIIGGLAVLSRLSTAYRVTTDLDTASRRAAGEPSQIEILLANADVEQAGPAGVWIPTPAGTVQVDVIEVSDSELDRLPDDETDRLAVLSHAWAIQTATTVRIRAVSLSPDFTAEAVASVAEPGPLIAMKLQSVMNRPVYKERTDLLDIVRLTLDRTVGQVAQAQLRDAKTQLAADARLHAHRWFTARRSQTLRLIRELPEGQDIDADTLQLVAELLQGALTRS